jgi:TPR repeat protein
MHDAVLAMGWFYLNGVGTAASKSEAIRWYRKSARQGDERAMFSLGQIAYWEQDFAEALLWFQRAVKKGHSRSEYWIGKIHWRGQGIPQDRHKAKHHFARAAAEKEPEAQRVLRYLSFLEKSKSPIV